MVPIDDDGRVEAFVEKPPPGQAPTNWINAGTYVLEPSVLERIPAGRRLSIERTTFPEMVADGSLYAMHSDSYWIDAGTPATYLQSQLDLIDGHRGEPEVAVSASAVIGEGAVVDHAVIMAGCQVDAGAVIRVDAVLLPGAKVGRGAEVVSWSIVGARASVGAGARLIGLSVDRRRHRRGGTAPSSTGSRVPDEDAT